jgi:hypothetical protein
LPERLDFPTSKSSYFHASAYDITSDKQLKIYPESYQESTDETFPQTVGTNGQQNKEETLFFLFGELS